MKNSMFLNTCGIAAMALCMTLNVACSESKQSAGGQGNPSPVAGSQFDGTSDGNGGNGVNGKMYESYIVKPSELPAYKNILAKKFDAIYGTEADATKRELAKKWFNYLLEAKTWFLAPVSLKSLSKKSLGVEFIEGSTEQLALQTENEIWIDAKAFAKMSEVEQATLIAHEFLMSTYLFDKKSDKEKCLRYQALAGFDAALCESSDGRAKKAELSTTDYNRIRKATALLMQLSANPTAEEIKQFSHIFEDSSENSEFVLSKEKNEKEISSERIATLLKKAKWAKSLNGMCRGVTTDIKIRCSYDVKFVENDTVQIVITNDETKEVLRDFKGRISKDTPTPMEKEGGAKKIMIAYGVVNQSYSMIEGSSQDTLDLILNSDLSEVIGANIRRKVIASATQVGPCMNVSEAKINATTLMEDDIRISASADILNMAERTRFLPGEYSICKNEDGSYYTKLQE